MNNDAPPIMWLILVVLGTMALGGMLAWVTLQYRTRRHALARRGLRPTDDSAPSLATLERRRGVERRLEAERDPSDPGAVQARDAGALAVIAIAAFAAGVLALGGMFLNNVGYEAASPAIGERSQSSGR